MLREPAFVVTAWHDVERVEFARRDRRSRAVLEVMALDVRRGTSWPGGALGDAAGSIEHIGSTAVEGLSAKPTIDILIVVERIEDFLERLPHVEALGFDYRANNTLVGGDDHLFLRKVVNGKRTHHVHVLRAGSPEIEEYRRFRDALRSDAALRNEYEMIKTALAARHSDDRMRYVTEKAEWVEGVVRSLEGSREP